jgi:WD40 repeat protein
VHRRFFPRLTSGAVLALLIACAADAQPPTAQPPRPAPEPGLPLPDGAVARIGRPRPEFPGAVINVAFAPTGTTFVTTGNVAQKLGTNRLVILWDAATGKEIRQFRGHRDNVDALAFSADGKRIATGGADKTVRLWKVETGVEIQVFTGHTATVLAVAYSPDGRQLASEAQDETIRLWDIETGNEVRRLPGHTSQGTSNLRYSPDGQLLAAVGGGVGKDHFVRLLDPKTGNLITRLTGPKADCESLDFSRDGSRLAAIDEDGMLWVWDVATGKELVRVQAHASPVGRQVQVGITVRFAPDGTLATGGGDGLIHFWSAEGKRLRSAAGHPGNLVSEIAFSADGSILASAGHDASVKLWEVATGLELPQSGGTVTQVALSADGKLLAASTGGTPPLPLVPVAKAVPTPTGSAGVRFWDPATGKEALPPLVTERPVGALAFAADGRTLITTDSVDELHFWDLETGKPLRVVGARTGTPVTRLAVGPAGRLVATAAGSTIGSTVRLWDPTAVGVAAAEPTTKFGPAATGIGKLTPLRAVAFSPGDTRVAVAGGDGRLHVWDIAAGRELFATPAAGLGPVANAVAWSPDGRSVATAGADVSLQVWEVASGHRRRPLFALPSVPWSVAFSPDGRILAAGGVTGFVQLYDVRAGRELAIRPAHAGPVTFLAFTPDGRSLVSAGADLPIPNPKSPNAVVHGDTTALVWDVHALVKDMPAIPRPTAADLDGLWAALKGDDAVKAHDAVWRLAAAPDLALLLLRERLPKVIPEGSGQRVLKLLADLDDDDFDVREKATAELIRMGQPAMGAVRSELATTRSREVRRRAEEIIAKLAAASPAGAEEILLARGFEVLQRLGTAEARALLEEWAKGPAASPLTHEAKATLAVMANPR